LGRRQQIKNCLLAKASKSKDQVIKLLAEASKSNDKVIK